MRVVAGRARGRRLQAPPGTDVRPTSDRVREAVFNSLGSLGAIEGADVLDLFAGTGALGIEALSRGAASAVFVEAHRKVAELIGQNLRHTDLADRAEVVTMAADRYLAGDPPPFDLALVDPPYAFDDWDGLLAALPADLAVLESDRAVAPPEPWVVVRGRRYGGTVVTIVRRPAATPTPEIQP
jgi:16S rRNA (guanine966-N2)-methyltransferase